VALARALVYEPEILLLDEPFSSLDAKLREQMRVELKQLQRRVGITVVFVTHDQEEALSLSDRIAVMERGEVIEVGAPQELYEQPGKPFVRDFLGKSVVLRGEVSHVGPDHQMEVRLVGKVSGKFPGNSKRTLVVHDASFVPASAGQPVVVAIRPEDIVVDDAIDGEEGGASGPSNRLANRLEGTIAALLFLGDRYECVIQVGEEQIVLYFPRGIGYREGQTVRVYFPPAALSVWKQ